MSEPTIWSYQENFDFRRYVDTTSPFHYPLEQHRGQYSRQRMLTAFHLDMAGQLRPGTKARESEAVLFGGHVRDLLRLVLACFARITADQITRAVPELAVRDVASEYDRLVRQSDWADPVRIDLSKGEEKDRTDDRLRLLHDLVLLEFNDYWWRSHPLVRVLRPYSKARDAAASS